MAPKSRKRIIITPTIVIDAAFTGAMRVAFTGVIAVATITDRGCDENGCPVSFDNALSIAACFSVPAAQSGTLSASLRKLPAGWRIAAWAWTKGTSR
jgi:hypothetical protein